MATANVGRYVVVTKERYEWDAWRSECFVGIDDPDLANVLFREGDCSLPFDGPMKPRGQRCSAGLTLPGHSATPR